MTTHKPAHFLKNYIIFLTLLLIASAVFFLWHAGFLTSIRIEKKSMGPYHIIYSSYQGDYTEGVGHINNIRQWLEDHHLPVAQGFGIYYDDPRHTAPEKLRAVVGHIIPDKNIIKEAGPIPFKTAIIPRQSYFVSSFPFRSRLSVLIGIMNVYPRAEELLNKSGKSKSGVMEIYDAEKHAIIYLFPLAQDTPLDYLYQP